MNIFILTWCGGWKNILKEISGIHIHTHGDTTHQKLPTNVIIGRIRDKHADNISRLPFLMPLMFLIQRIKNTFGRNLQELCA